MIPPDYQYEVSVTNTFDADDVHDAVRQMIEWLESTDPSDMSYRVQREHQDAVDWIDGKEVELDDD